MDHPHSTRSPGLSALPYRPDIDGLRAVAVLAVIAFHAAPAQIPAGFVGVDVFFVISGYLISAQLLKTPWSVGALARFYGRRIRRLLPAMLTVLGLATATAWAILSEPDWLRYLKHLTGAAFFMPNFIFMRETGYFSSPTSNPLLHFWSLGVEEQFYIAWPLTLWAICLVRRRIGIVCALAACSFILNIVLVGSAESTAFYSPATRAWQFLAGAILAIRQNEAGNEPARWCDAKSVLAAALLLTSFLLIRAEGYPGWWSILPTMAAALFIAAGPGSWLNAKLLSHPAAVWVGLISYPLYLWHWPLISFAATLTFDRHPWTWRLAAVLISFPAAWVTYRLIERPCRRAGALVTLLLLAALVALGVGAMAAQRSDAVRSSRPDRDARIDFVSSYRNLTLDRTRWINCSYGLTARTRVRIPQACVPVGAGKTWLVLGDSHGQSLARGLRVAVVKEIAIAEITGSGCPPLTTDRERCRRATDHALAYAARVRPEVVLLVQQGRHDRRDWTGIARLLKERGAGQVILVGPVPQWRRSLPQIAATVYWPDIPTVIETELDPRAFETDRRLRNRPPQAGYRYLSLIQELCSPQGCRAVVPSLPGRSSMLHSDYGHLTPAGAAFVARRIVVPAVQAEHVAR
jgi:peptidoglycan/LPS O-acetylase OafA/YrhL